MKTVTVRFPEEEADELDGEADEKDQNRSEFIRELFRNRHEDSQRLQGMQSEYDRLQEEHSELQDEYETLQREHADLREAHARLQDEHAELQSEHERIQDECERLQDEKEQLQTNVDRLDRKLAAALDLNEEKNELANYVEEEKTYRSASLIKRMKWKVFGMED